ncbi:hypothetical protein ACEWY4_000262 [Coilia grayii]|uniref:TNFR-Cys domain-containing protein n=1 Tax=Coilia grayii TaxID=363190 RepID=A0ABD1KW51_9TELE
MDMVSTSILLVVFAILQPINGGCRKAEYTSVSGECCPMCQKGLVVRKDCTEISSTSCIPCLDGTFMDEPNGYNKCHQCKTCDSSQGLNTVLKCTTINDARCDVVEGYYCESFSLLHDCTFAVKHTVCTPGQRVKTPGSKISDTECEDCPKGQYSIHGFNCTVWTDCSAIGKEKAEEGSPISDVICRDIARHRYTLLLCAAVSFSVYGFVFYHFMKSHKKSAPHSSPIQETDTGSKLRLPTPESAKSGDSAYGGSSNIPEESEDPQTLRSVTPTPV